MAVRVPILHQGDILISSIQEELSDTDILALQERLLEQVVRHGAVGVVVDVGALDVLDSFGTRTLCDIAQSVRLRGAQMCIVGIQPEVAYSMVLLGVTLQDIPTARDLDQGMALLRKGRG